MRRTSLPIWSGRTHCSRAPANIRRGKGTGQFSIDVGGKREFIVAMGDEIKAFDAFVRGLA